MVFTPLVSIAISNFNYAPFVGQAIDSALAQTYRHTEIIVVDDGSTDASREVIAGYGDRITAVFKPNAGHASALNAGFARSAGDVVLFLDSDDVLLPGAVERVVSFFQDPQVSKVHWPLRMVRADGRDMGRLIPGPTLADGDLRHQAMRVGPGVFSSSPTSGNAWARWFLRQLMPIDEPLYRAMGEMSLLDAAPLFGIVRAVPEPLALYRTHEGSMHSAHRIEDKVARMLPMADRSMAFLADYCRRQGHAVDLAEWQRHSWWHRTQRLCQTIAALPDPAAPVILLDGGALDLGPIAGRQRLPFPEHAGQYWGPPADDVSAVAELHRLRAATGAAFLAVAWTAFWWLDHYQDFAAHLRSTCVCRSADDVAAVFDLRARP